jgi:type III secretory pathway component EscU
MKNQKKNKKNIHRGIYSIIILIYFIFVINAYLFGISSGIEIGKNLVSFLSYMMKIVPCAFILIGLFEVWVSRENVEKHLGIKVDLKGA